MRAIVVGGGIGGAAAALALTIEGIDAVLLEQAPALTEAGGGLRITANGTRALRYLGLLRQFGSVAAEPESYRIMGLETGELLHERPLNAPEGGIGGPGAAPRAGAAPAAHFGGQCYQAHRADLLAVLVNALPEGTVRTGARCAGVEQSGDTVTVTLSSGERISGDIVVGADGIHSAVRESVFGPARSVPTGTAAWRTLIPAGTIADLGLAPAFHGWHGRDRIAIGYWARAGEFFNLAVFLPDDEPKRESWSQRGNRGDLRRAMEGAEPLLAELADRAEDAFVSAPRRYQPLDAWTRGRVTLLGDAAHAVAPYTDQAVNQALEDAVVLGRLLGKAGRSGDTAAALETYQRLRRPRTTKIQSDVLALAGPVFAGDPARRTASQHRLQAQDRDDPRADSRWGYICSYDPVLEASLGDTRRHPAMSLSRASRQPVWPPPPAARQPWSEIFGFDALAGGDQAMRVRYEAHFASGVAARPVELGGVKGLEVGAARFGGPVIVHVHGGGYVLGSARASVGYADALAGAADAVVTVLDHRLAPEHPWPAPVEDLLSAYQALLETGIRPDRIVLSGESSGAAVTLAALVRLRDSGQPPPAGGLLVSPFADLTLASESMAVNGFADEFLTRDRFRYWATCYTQRHDPAKGDVSPVFADLSDLPPLLLLAARGEATASDAIRIAGAAGGTARLVLADTATHAYPIFPDEPASAPSIALLGATAVKMISNPKTLNTLDTERTILTQSVTSETSLPK
ncbi:MAG: alpha/beta hydrolase fold domain-containing protein [Nocardiopsaceae bacterium]|nr:alpha/beta hydrolase fold domain-containing protein [Nocardiopsaceae bacterium]